MNSSPRDLRAMNDQMTARLLAQPAQPLEEGGYALRVLEVSGRHSGRPVSTPIGVLSDQGRRLLVSPDASRDWVANLRATGSAALRAGDSREDVTASELHGREAATAVLAYLAVAKAPWVTAAFAVPDGTQIAEIEAQHLDRMAVFEISAAGSATSTC